MSYGRGKREFGQVMKKSNKSTRYQRQFGNASSSHSQLVIPDDPEAAAREEAVAKRRARQEQGEAIDLAFGYERIEDKPIDPNHPPVERRGWLFHMLPTTVSFPLVIAGRNSSNSVDSTNIPPPFFFFLFFSFSSSVSIKGVVLNNLVLIYSSSMMMERISRRHSYIVPISIC